MWGDIISKNYRTLNHRTLVLGLISVRTKIGMIGTQKYPRVFSIVFGRPVLGVVDTKRKTGYPLWEWIERWWFPSQNWWYHEIMIIMIQLSLSSLSFQRGTQGDEGDGGLVGSRKEYIWRIVPYGGRGPLTFIIWRKFRRQRYRQYNYMD